MTAEHYRPVAQIAAEHHLHHTDIIDAVLLDRVRGHHDGRVWLAEDSDVRQWIAAGRPRGERHG